MESTRASVVFRSMTIDDYPAVRALWESLQGQGLGPPDSSEVVARVLDRNPEISSVAMAGEVVVGAVLAGHDGRRGLIYHLAVAPAFQNRGVGRDLVRRVVAAFRFEGIEKAYLLVFKEQQERLAFWTKTGAIERTDISLLTISTA